MKSWLNRLANAEHCEIEVNLSRWGPAVIVKAGGFQVSLREPVDLPDHAASLEHSLILGDWQRGFPNAGGLHKPLTAFDTFGHKIGIPDDALAFFTTAAGDKLFACGDRATWCSKGADLVDAGAIADVLVITRLMAPES